MHSLSLDRPDLDQHREDSRHADGKRLVRALGVSRGHRVLDIGCGTGRLGAHVAQVVGLGGEVVGIDPLPLRVAVAAKREPSVFKASVGAAEDLSRFDADYFDVVSLNGVLHWSADQARVPNEVPRAVGWHALSALINQAGYSSHTLSDEVLTDYHATLDHVLAFPLNSELGGFLLDLDDDQYEQLRQGLSERLQPFTTSKGIRLERYLIYAVANRHR